MNCPRCGLKNPTGFAFCMRCAAALVSATPWLPAVPGTSPQPDVQFGRDTELTELQESVRNLIAGQGGIVSVIGAPGLGKSQLVAELRRRSEREIGPDAPPPIWLTATCYPPGETPTSRAGASVPGLEVASQVLQAYLGPGEDPVVELEQAVHAQLPGEAEFVIRYLTNLVSSSAVGPQRDGPLATEPGQRHVFKSFARLLSVLSQLAPLVLVIEEMHWIDESSAALLEHLWPLIRQQPVLFVLLYEPEEERRCWDLRRQAANFYADSYREVFLYPLPEAEAERLLDHLLGRAYLTASTHQVILQAAEGNPLFLREVLLWRRQVDPGDWQDDALPATLPDLLAARIALLSPEARRVLQIAAVVGPIFPRRVLAQALISDGQGEDALQHLQHLQALEMIRPHSSPDIRHAYAFAHPLVRRATYESLTEGEREHLHLLVAQAIERDAQGRLAEYYASLAHHYARTARFDLALQYMRRAGDQALHRYANHEAMAYYQAGLRLAATRPDLAEERRELLRRIATIHARRGEWLENVRAHEHVLAMQADDPVGQAETYHAISLAHRCLGDREAEDYYVEKALAVLPATAAPSLRATLYLAQSNVHWARGDQSTASSAARQALNLAQQAQDDTLVVMAWNQLGAVYLLAGDDVQAREAFLYALDACESTNVEPDARLRVYLNAGEMQSQIVGDLAVAQDLFMRALTLAQHIGHDTWATWAHANLAELAFDRGDWDQAAERLQQAEDLCTGRNLAIPTLHLTLLRGRLLLARGQARTAYEQARHAAELAESAGEVVQGLIPARLGQALALWSLGRREPACLLLEQTLHLSQEDGTLSNVATTAFHLVRALLARGDTATAQQVYDRVAPTLASLQRPQVQARNLWLRGLLAAATGQTDAAERDLRASQQAWQKRGYRYQEGQILLDLARFYQTLGRESDAVQSRDEAIALFQILGAAGDLEQAEVMDLPE